MSSSCSTPRGDYWSVSRYGGATVPARVYIMASGPSNDMPCELTANRARELADMLIYEAGRADEINAAKKG